jgi:uncharacterized membrane protein
MVYTNDQITVTASFIACSDGMSNENYPLTLLVDKEGTEYNGCGKLIR